MKPVKNLIFTSPNKADSNRAAQAALQLIPYKFTTRLNNAITDIYLAQFKVFPYLKAVLVEDCSAKQIVEITKRIELYNPNIAIIFTSTSPCLEIAKDDRYNIIEVC